MKNPPALDALTAALARQADPRDASTLRPGGDDIRVLLEMRPALDGYAGIPQETRLLFRGLREIGGMEVEGLLQSSTRVLARGLPANANGLSEDRRVNRLSKVVVSLLQNGKRSRQEQLRAGARLAWQHVRMVLGAVLGLLEPMGVFEPARFRDFVWRSLFAKTLPDTDFAQVTRANYRVLRTPWTALHSAALATRRFGHAVYPRLDTRGYDVLISETPFPGRVAAPTQLVVRYHDAIPLLMPHTISDRAYHQASHYEALRRNVRDGAWFACVSEATRQDLISVFPQAETRAVTIPNMVSHHYFAEASAPDRVAEILRTRRNATLSSGNGGGASVSRAADGMAYLLMVSTIEPRKNHLTLLAAWERLRSIGHADLRLVFVGSLGWDHSAIVKKFQPWLERGGLHLLEDVPSEELRLLYRHAQVTVCPSYGEGFDYPGVEAMRCSGIVAASDIAVHREVFGDAAEYFSPYSAEDLAASLGRLLGNGADAAKRRDALRSIGEAVALRYLPEHVLPQWQSFLDRLTRTAASHP